MNFEKQIRDLKGRGDTDALIALYRRISFGARAIRDAEESMRGRYPPCWPSRPSEDKSFLENTLSARFEILKFEDIDRRLLDWLGETHWLAGTGSMYVVRLPHGVWGELWAVMPPERAHEWLSERELLLHLPRKSTRDRDWCGTTGVLGKIRYPSLVVRARPKKRKGWALS